MRARKTVLLIGSGVVAGFIACGGSTPPPADPESMPAAVSEPPDTVASAPAPVDETPREVSRLDVPPPGASSDRIMEAHFNDALLIREAVIAGRPEETARPAHIIANSQKLDELPKGWRPFVEEMQRTASRINNSTTVATAAAAAADLGASCGGCHQKFGGPAASTEPLPAAGKTIESRMERHIWATERLWDSLAVPSHSAWDIGAQALIGDAFPSEVLKKGGVDARTSANDLARLVAKAPSKKTVAARAALYAELLVTCGACHRAMSPDE